MTIIVNSRSEHDNKSASAVAAADDALTCEETLKLLLQSSGMAGSNSTGVDSEARGQPKGRHCRGILSALRGLALAPLSCLRRKLLGKLQGLAGSALGFLADVVLDVLGFGLGAASGVVLTCLVLDRKRRRGEEEPPHMMAHRILHVSSPHHLQSLREAMPLWVQDPGFEPVTWLNRVMAKAWPFIDPVLVTWFKDSVWPGVCRRYSTRLDPDLLVFKEASLGSLPLSIAHVRTLETVEDECILEINLVFASNCSVHADFQLAAIKRYGFLRPFLPVLPLHLTEFSGSMTLRVTLKPLIGQFPCFAAAAFSLMKQPVVDGRITTLGGLDAFLLPPIRSLILRKISRPSALILWPLRGIIPVRFSPASNPPSASLGSIVMKIIRGHSLLLPGLIFPLSPFCPSPYVKICTASGKIVKTSVRESTNNPVWNETFWLPVTEPTMDVVSLEVLDNNAMIQDDFIGTCCFLVASLQPGQPKRMRLPLRPHQDSTFGSLELQATFWPFQQQRLQGEGRAEGGAGKDGLSGRLDWQELRRERGMRKGEKMRNKEEEKGKRAGQSEEGYRGVVARDQKLKRSIESGFPFRSELSPTGGGGVLRILIRRAIDLEFDAADDDVATLCKLFANGEVCSTSAIAGAGHPSWDEAFEFSYPYPPISERVIIEVWHRDESLFLMPKFASSPGQLVGVLDLRLIDVVVNHRIVDDFQLHQAKRGSLKLDLHWLPFESVKKKGLDAF